MSARYSNLDQQVFDPPEYGPGCLIDASQVAKILGVSERTVWRLRSAAQMPAPLRIGGLVRWRYTDIIAWIDEGCRPPNHRRETQERS